MSLAATGQPDMSRFLDFCDMSCDPEGEKSTRRTIFAPKIVLKKILLRGRG